MEMSKLEVKILDNINQTVKDDMKSSIRKGSKISIAASCFSMYAYKELKKQLEEIDEWVSTDEPHKIKYLVEGKEYILTEKIAPKGYELAESITFTAKDGTKITMKDKLIPEIPQTGDQTNLGLWLGLSGISILAVIALLARKRKKDDVDEK